MAVPELENATVAGSKDTAAAMVVKNGPVHISEQDDRLYRHITLPNHMQVC